MDEVGLGGVPEEELENGALRLWIQSLPEQLCTVVARDARIHIPRRWRGHVSALIWERSRRSPYSQAVVNQWFRKAYNSLIQQARAFSGPVEPDGVQFCRQLREDHQLSLITLAWVLAAAGRRELVVAISHAFSSEWAELAAERMQPADAAEEDAGPADRHMRRTLRDAQEEVGRLRSAVRRQERDLVSLRHRLDQALRRLSAEGVRRQELRAEVAAADRRRAEEERRWQQRVAELEEQFGRERAEWQEQVQHAHRLAREREQALEEAILRTRRAREEAVRQRTMFLTLRSYLELTAPGEGIPLDAFTAYGRWLERLAAELAARCTPEEAGEVAPRLVRLQHALAVHQDLAPLLALPEVPAPGEADPWTGPLVQETAEGRERFFVRLPERLLPLDLSVVMALGALPGDVIAVEPRCERTPGGAHFYLYYHLRTPRPRVEEIAVVRPGGPPWWADTSRGPMPVIGAPDREFEAGQPVVVVYPERADPQEAPSGCLIVRALPYDLPARHTPVRPGRTADRDAAERDRPRRRPQLLAGRTIYILGGEGFESYYRHVVESYGGNLIWTSGFSEVRQISHRVRQADAVVLVTRGVSHKAYDHLQSAVAATGRPLFYCNALGQSQLERVLEQEVIPSLCPPDEPAEPS